MSCEVKAFANISDLKKVQELFGFAHDENWLNAVIYSISPTLETIAFAHGNKLVFMTSQWTHSNHKLPTYVISYKGELEDENEIITSMICLPIFGSGINTGADWTCVAVGLSSGLVQFFIDSGVQIFSQRWHSESVVFLKAQSGNRLIDEVHIGYISCICVIQGVHLFTVLKGMKQIILKSSKTSLQVPETVLCRKWEYKSRTNGSTNDAVIVGIQESCAFDHYLEQSLEKGFYAKCRSAPPQNSLVIGVGVKPYTGFYYAKEGYVAPDFGDVAKAVANKVISAIPGWFFKSSSKQNNSQQTNENESTAQSSEPMNCRFGICDIQRQANNIWLAPGNQLAAVTDNLHRVILIDVNRGIALRIWKGYRDAQCGFLRVKEKALKSSDKTDKRKSLFLIIFVPRMSCLEIWALQNGPRVAAFTVSKNGQLSYNTHSLMAVSSGSKPKITACHCVFIDPSDETLKDISVPFHCALSEGNSKTAKDIHLLRRLKVFLRADAKEDDIISEVEVLCSNLQTDELRLQCLDILTKNKRLKAEVLLVAVKTLEKCISEVDEESNLFDDNQANIMRTNSQTSSHKSMATLLKNYEQLTEFYLRIKSFYPHNDQESVKTNYAKLALSESDLETIQTLLDLGQYNKSNFTNVCKVKFEDKQHSGDFIEFLNVFVVDTASIYLNPRKKDLYGFVGVGLFSKFLELGQDLNSYVQSIQDTIIPNEDLLSLVLYYWLERPFHYIKCEEVIEDMTRLGIAIQIICDKAESVIRYEYNSISAWWQNIREMLLESPSATRGLLAAMVCRNISFAMQKNEKNSEGDYDEEGEEVWEQVSQEAAQWALLIGKLDDVSVLGAILSAPMTSKNLEMPIIQYTRPDCSLKAILCNGKGIVSELTAKWLTNSGICPKRILETKSCKPEHGTSENPLENENPSDVSLLNTETTEDLVLLNLQTLRQHFPFSLESGILLCHMCWDFMSYWSKNLSELEYLKAGLQCLNIFKEEDFALKHGLCCMIWNAHLKIPLEATKKLIHKAGKLPKEKLCQQEIGMSMQAVTDFLDYCLEFLKNFQNSLEHEKRELKFEEILQDDQIPLTFLALQQNHAILEILLLHVQLCKALHFISFFSLKVQKPMTSLFDPIANQTFFVEINRELNYSLTKPDFVLQKQRDEFLCQAVSASMDLIREDLERLYIVEHAEYMEKIEELADMWDLEKNIIKKHQVVEVYAHGWDTYGEELLQSIIDKDSIGPLLLEIAGRRLNLFSSNSSSIFCQVASIGPQLLNYLDNLKTNTNGVQITQETPEEINLKSLTVLAARVFECLSTKKSRFVHISGQLYDACVLLNTVLS